MWARVSEGLIGTWLIASPWSVPGIRVSGAVALALAVASHKWEKAYLGTLLVGAWLVVQAYGTFPAEATYGEENAMLVGVVLLLFACVPSRESPPSWR